MKDKSIKFSIIIPIYNTEAYLADCFNSILNQDYKNFEVIMINDGSSDGSELIAIDFENKYENFHLISVSNGGQSKARNIGLNSSNGDYILFLDSDDMYASNCLNELQKIIKSIGDIDAVYFNRQVIKDKDNGLAFTTDEMERKSTLTNQKMLSSHYYNLMIKEKDFYSSACYSAYSRKSIVNIRFKEGIIHEDELFTAEYLNQSNVWIYCVNDKFYVRRIRDNSTMTSKPSIKNINGYCTILNEMTKINVNLYGVNKHKTMILSGLIKVWPLCLNEYKLKEQIFMLKLITGCKVGFFNKLKITVKFLLSIFIIYKNTLRKLFKHSIVANKIYLLFKKISSIIVSDVNYRKKMYYKKFNKEINLVNPKTFNEKINYRILFERNEIFTDLADKYKVRDYVKEKIGENYLIPLFKVFKYSEDININNLPNSFVMKCNHDYGSVIIVNDKELIDLNNIKKHFKLALINNLYYKDREWHYKNIEKCILIEEKIDIFCNDVTPEDFKFHCFNGKVKYIEVQFSRFSKNRRINIYNSDWVLQPFLMGYENTKEIIDKPSRLSDMIIIADKLSDDFDYCRVDLYLTKSDKIYFGEITFTPCNGMDVFIPEQYGIDFCSDWNVTSNK